ncbi:TetR/AcrR family transcriptional regulator [Paenibacillus gorillae]|uniref:TetR/AcrR family transcriptional regulator n=1 Tax=Paenibacillus gorillae TaxID=1243662 RepID=UPI0005AA4FCC|nr:TetR/AcrR family transcriptional regulator [Paenibacillus gorillae]
MPKIVDHDRRREQLAEAAWRVIRREGMEGVSVRSVAEEAGMSLGSLRHYFVTQSELLAFSMQLVSERVTRRLKELKLTGDPRQNIELIVAQLVPLDEERLAESEVWLAFMGRAVGDSSIRAFSLQVHDQLYNGFLSIVSGMVVQGLAAGNLDVELEAKRLHALVDGLVVHGVTRPERLTAAEINRVLLYHLDQMMDK